MQINQQTYAELYIAGAKLKGIKPLTPDERFSGSMFGYDKSQKLRLEAENEFKEELHAEMVAQGISAVVDAEGNPFNWYPNGI